MTGRPTVVWIAGTNWDAVAGTDRRMVEALSSSINVLWVDPPIGWRPSRGTHNVPAEVTNAAPGVTRLTVTTLPGVTKPGIRALTSLILSREVRTTLASRGITSIATVVAFPLARFPTGVGGTRTLYVTDDWVSGASLMGFSTSVMTKAITANVLEADMVAAVSPVLVDQLSLMGGSRVLEQFVLPNGCPSPVPTVETGSRQRVVGLVGTLNERLDLDLLEAVRDTGAPFRVIGPRSSGSRMFESRLDAFLASPNVEWLGAIPGDAVQSHLAQITVGITPYGDSTFNRASFPLKTLEYLAAGVPVISTDLPSARWLDSSHISLHSTPAAFADAVLDALDHVDSVDEANARRAFAAMHTWDSRAAALLKKLGIGENDDSDTNLIENRRP